MPIKFYIKFKLYLQQFLMYVGIAIATFASYFMKCLIEMNGKFNIKQL